tara:strand:- start:5 stop:151 length:147 start_codon:yes stop_codon:yes gene_type:complete
MQTAFSLAFASFLLAPIILMLGTEDQEKLKACELKNSPEYCRVIIYGR